MYTENGSGGSRTGVLTTFEDGDDGGDYDRILAEFASKVDSIYSYLGKTAIIERAPRKTTRDWLGQHAVFPQLDIPTLDQVTSLYEPLAEAPNIRGQHN